MFYRRLEAILGITDLHSEHDLTRLVEMHLPLSSVESLLVHGMTHAEIYKLIVSRRTLARRKSRHESLTRDESDRAIRVVRIISQAEEAFGNDTKAAHWLRSSKTRLEGRTPLEMLRTETGARIVEKMLLQLDYGFTA